MNLKSTNSSFRHWFKKRNRTIAGCVAILIFCVLMLIVIYYTLDSSGSTMCKFCPKISFTEYKKVSMRNDGNVCKIENEDCNLICRSLDGSKIEEKVIEGTQNLNCEEISLHIYFTSFSYGRIETDWLRKLKVNVKKLEFLKTYFEEIKPGAFTDHPFAKLETLVISDARVQFLSRNIFTGMNSLKYFAIDFENLNTVTQFDVEPDVFGDINLQKLTIHKLLNSHKQIPNLLNRNLKIVDFSFNTLKEISAETFTNLGFVENLNLSNNNLKKIDVNAFKSMDVVTLDLSNNEIKHLDEGTFYTNSKFPKEILADGNPWNCKCSLYWFKEFVLMENSPVRQDRPPLCEGKTKFEDFHWDTGCLLPTTRTTTTTTTEKPTTTPEKPTTITEKSTTTTEMPTTEKLTSTITTTMTSSSSTARTTTEDLTTEDPTTISTTKLSSTTTEESQTENLTTSEEPTTVTLEPITTTKFPETTTVEESTPTSTTASTGVSIISSSIVTELSSTTVDLTVTTDNKTTTDVVETPRPDLIKVNCQDGGKNPPLLLLEAKRIHVEDIEISIRNQTISFSFYNLDDFPALEIRLSGDYVGFNLIYYESSKIEVSCVGNLQEKIYLEDLHPATFYTFCLHRGYEKEVAARGCFGVKTLEVWERRTWLENGTKGLVIGTFLSTVFLSIFISSVVVFLCIRQHPNLIKGNKRVIIVGNKTTEAVILPKETTQPPTPPPIDFLHDPSYITPIYEKLKYKPSFRKRSLSDASISSYIIPHSRKTTLVCTRDQRAQPEDVYNGYEVSNLPPPLPPCHPTQENIYEDNIYFAPQC